LFYLVAAEPYMAPKLQSTLGRFLSRSVAFDEKFRTRLSAQEASKVAAYAGASPENGGR
jgi:hypothetical protein